MYPCQEKKHTCMKAYDNIYRWTMSLIKTIFGNQATRKSDAIQVGTNNKMTKTWRRFILHGNNTRNITIFK